jgi:hypothetical protein
MMYVQKKKSTGSVGKVIYYARTYDVRGVDIYGRWPLGGIRGR